MADRRTDPDPEKTESEESFVTRWSRRKREAEREPHRQSSAAQEMPSTDPAKAAEPEPTDADLPPADALGSDSDYSGYLSSRVSEDLRRAALRKLFRLPAFNVRDGLDDYDEDYRSFAALGDTITADMRHHEERLRDKARQSEQEAQRAAGETAPEAPPAEADDTGAPAGAEPGEETAGGQDGTTDDPDEDTQNA